MGKKSNRFSPEVRECAVRMVHEHRGEYAFRPNNLRSYKHKKTVTPFHLWQEMSRNVVPGGVVLEEEFNKALYFERSNRALNSSGIVFDTFNYNSPELAQLWERYGPGRSYDIRSTTLSANIIYVDPGDGGELILAHAKELEEWSMDRVTAKQVRAKLKADGKVLGRMARGELRKQLEELEREAENQTPKKKAQIAEKLKHADRITRETMPKKTNASPSTIQTASDNWDFEDASLAGRTRGDF